MRITKVNKRIIDFEAAVMEIYFLNLQKSVQPVVKPRRQGDTKKHNVICNLNTYHLRVTLPPWFNSISN